jgi:hypothetical protein
VGLDKTTAQLPNAARISGAIAHFGTNRPQSERNKARMSVFRGAMAATISEIGDRAEKSDLRTITNFGSMDIVFGEIDDGEERKCAP